MAAFARVSVTGWVQGDDSAASARVTHGGWLQVAATGGGGGPSLTSPTGVATGNTTATASFSTDTASGTAYYLRRTGGTPADQATVESTGESQAVSGTGAQSRAMTVFTSGTAYYVDMTQTGASGVVSAGPFTPSTLAYSGTLTDQTASSGAAITWTGDTPAAGVTGGIGTKTYSLGAGSLTGSGLSVNSSTGVLTGTAGTAGTYSALQILVTDQSTAGSEIPQTELTDAFDLVISSSAATSMTIALKQSDGTTAAASITGIEYAVLDAATLGSATAILDAGTGESTDGSGNLVLDITGLGLTVGQVRYVIAGKSNGTAGADFDGWHGPVTAA